MSESVKQLHAAMILSVHLSQSNIHIPILEELTAYTFCNSQINGDCVQGRILHGHSPTELIENFTETIGRPPELPEWIISGAVVGMQGGTDAVRNAWNQLQTYNVPISAFWLQVKNQLK